MQNQCKHRGTAATVEKAAQNVYGLAQALFLCDSYPTTQIYAQ